MTLSGLRLSVVALLAVSAGCRVAQVQQDHDQFRAALVEMTTNQVMDNLIRAYNGLPIIQLDYTRATGTITQRADAGIGGSQTVSDSRVAAAVATFSRAITTAISYSIAGQQTNQLTVTAEPVLNNNEVYDAYLEFLAANDERGPRLIATFEPPPCEAAHIVKKCGKTYYWIPVDFKYDFLELALATTVQRGQPLSLPESFERTVVDVALYEDEDGEPTNYAVIALSQGIANDSGALFAELNRQKFEFRIAPHPDFGAETRELLINYRRVAPGDAQFELDTLRVALRHEQVKIKLDHHVPSLPTTRDHIRDLRAELEQIRLQDVSQ